MTAGTGAYGWRFDSGRLCLDLLGTEPPGDGRAGTPDPLRGSDAADGSDRLADWLTSAGIVPRATFLTCVDARWLRCFTDLRERVGLVVRAEITGREAPAALEYVNTRAETAPPGIRAVRDGDGTLVRVLSARPACEALLAVVARDAVELLTDGTARGLLRQCAGDHCRRVYLDTSRGGRRRWCSSELCGNRERVARHRRRAAAPAGA